MQTQTTQSIYKVQQLPNRQFSLFDDKGEPVALRIGKKQVTAFYWLDIVCGKIRAKYEDKFYLFNANLRPIPLPIGKVKRLALTFVYLYDNGIIKARHGWAYYLFDADLKPIV
jgi:hypothetical protein